MPLFRLLKIIKIDENLSGFFLGFKRWLVSGTNIRGKVIRKRRSKTEMTELP